MQDKLDELHYIYKMIGNYGFCTVQELLDEYNSQKEIIDKAVEYINKFKDSPEYIDAYDITYWQDEVLQILEDKEVKK